jgi:hypothetical protein
MDQYSQYEHSDCEFEEITESINIECSDCITKFTQLRCCKTTGRTDYFIDCKCADKIIMTKKCKICESVNMAKQALEDELDGIMYNFSYDIKHCKDCESALRRISELSVNLRQYNRILIEHL